MINFLKDVSLNTFVGNFVDIHNFNNRQLEKEFANIFDISYNRLIRSLYSPNGYVKAHNGDFVNLDVDNIQVNNKDSLLNLLEGVDHNRMSNRFKEEVADAGILHDYSHDALDIYYSYSTAKKSVSNVKEALDDLYELVMNGQPIGATRNSMLLDYEPMLFGSNAEPQEIQEISSLIADSETLDPTLYTMSAAQLRKVNLPKYKIYDIKKKIEYTYYTYSQTVTVTDVRFNSIDGRKGQTVRVKFDETDQSADGYVICLSRKRNSFVKLSKDPLNILRLVCIDYTDEFGAEWDIDSYSVRNENGISLF